MDSINDSNLYMKKAKIEAVEPRTDAIQGCQTPSAYLRQVIDEYDLIERQAWKNIDEIEKIIFKHPWLEDIAQFVDNKFVEYMEYYTPEEKHYATRLCREVRQTKEEFTGALKTANEKFIKLLSFIERRENTLSKMSFLETFITRDNEILILRIRKDIQNLKEKIKEAENDKHRAIFDREKFKAQTRAQFLAIKPRGLRIRSSMNL